MREGNDEAPNDETFDEEALIDYLISVREAVEYGEPWTETTTYEWWHDADGHRHARQVMSYHGGGSRGDDDEAEYVRRLLDLGRAVEVGDHAPLPDPATTDLPAEVTHVIKDGKAERFRFYVGPPDDAPQVGFGIRTLLAAASGLPSSSRNGARVIWVTLHTAEGSRRAIDLFNFFNANQNASSHVGIDGSGYYDWVGRDRAAWTLLNGNPVSVNAELCGFARWSREQWLSTGVVDGVVNPRAMVRNAALWAQRECEALGIPKQYIGVDGVRARRAGVIIHWDYSRGTGDGDHWDTGSGFPWDVFFADMNGGQESEDEVSAEEVWNFEVTNPSTGKKTKIIDLIRYICAENIGPLVWNHVEPNANGDKVAMKTVAHATDKNVGAVKTTVEKLTAAGIDVAALAKAIATQVLTGLEGQTGGATTEELFEVVTNGVKAVLYNNAQVFTPKENVGL